MRSMRRSLSGLVLVSVIGLFCTPLLLGGVAGVAHAEPGVSAAVAPVASVDVAKDVKAAVPSSVEQTAVTEPVDAFGKIGDWLQVLSLIIAACAGVAALTPTPKDDGIFLTLRRIVDFLALNFGHAKNVKPISRDRFTN